MLTRKDAGFQRKVIWEFDSFLWRSWKGKLFFWTGWLHWKSCTLHNSYVADEFAHFLWRYMIHSLFCYLMCTFLPNPKALKDFNMEQKKWWEAEKQSQALKVFGKTQNHYWHQLQSDLGWVSFFVRTKSLHHAFTENDKKATEMIRVDNNYEISSLKKYC